MKKFIALLLAVLCMAVLLTACKNNPPAPTPTPEPVAEETAPAEESPAPTAEEPPADDGAGDTEDTGEETGDA